MLPIDDATTLPLLYHINSEPWLNLEAYADPAHEVQWKHMEGAGAALVLPHSSADSPVRRLLRARRSCREFDLKPLPLARLADILENAYGILGLVELLPGQPSYARPVPSAGALYPMEIYAATQSVEGLTDGVYHYNTLDHSLEPLKPDPLLADAGRLLLGQDYLRTGNAALFLSAVFERTLNKYGPRGYRYILLEAGHAAQTICLLATELGLGSICLGGFYDGKLNRYLGLDGRTEAVIYTIGLGHPAPAA